MQKRVVRVISYEGLASWVDYMLAQAERESATLFAKHGTRKELQRIELKDGERLQVQVTKERRQCQLANQRAPSCCVN